MSPFGLRAQTPPSKPGGERRPRGIEILSQLLTVAKIPQSKDH
jgi:hypothetical protein